MALLGKIATTRSADDVSPLHRDRDGSFAAYFSAFPASYWQRWTTLRGVELRVRARGSGLVRVWRSDTDGQATAVADIAVSETEAVVPLPLTGFDEGGWYWFDLEGAELVDAGWWAPADVEPVRHCRPSLGITTLHREEYLLPMLRALAVDADVLGLLDRIIVVDHGSRRLRDAEGFDEVETALAGRLHLVEQPNLGGSGGFSRAMLETLEFGSDAVIILDDDVALDPESLRRMIRFEEYAREPLVVGGHMFDMQRRTRLLAIAEGFRKDRFIWRVLGPSGLDLEVNPLRSTPALHRRGDAEYTGWWMCLIPAEVLRTAGLSFPFFLKWDDAEFGLRAAEHGVHTVTLPGAAVWHVSWDDKDDTVDWQAFFHGRNRLLAALLHSPYRHGRFATWQEIAIAIKNVLALEYGAQALRNDGYRAVLAGPAALHPALADGIGGIRASLAAHASGVTIPRADAPEATSTAAPSIPRPTGLALLGRTLSLAGRALRPGRQGAPEAELSPDLTRWWIQGRYDSVLVAAATPGSVRWLRRDRRIALGLLRDAWRLTRRIRREWPRLATDYRAALPDLVSSERWRETTGSAVTS